MKALSIIGVIVLAVGTYLYLGNSKGTLSREVPNLTGKGVEQALEVLKPFTPGEKKIVPRESSEPEGKIIGQEPAPGDMWGAGNEIVLYVSSRHFAVELNATPQEGKLPLMVEFTATSGCVEISKYLWELGDGTVRETDKTNLSYVYRKPGVYRVKVTAVKNDRATASDSTDIRVKSPPAVKLTAKPVEGLSPLTVEFSAASSDEDGRIDKYKWVLGGGTAKETQKGSLSHTYQNPGIYLAKVTVVDNDNLTASDSTEIKVKSSPPAVRLTATPDKGFAPLTVKFTAISGEGKIIRFLWELGDGKVRETASGHLSHTYRKPGVHRIKVTAVNHHDLTASDSTEIRVKTRSMPDLTLLSYSEALRKIKKLNLVPGTITYQISSKPIETVVGQNPEPGTRYQAKQEIDLILSRGQRLWQLENMTKSLCDEGYLLTGIITEVIKKEGEDWLCMLHYKLFVGESGKKMEASLAKRVYARHRAKELALKLLASQICEYHRSDHQ